MRSLLRTAVILAAGFLTACAGVADFQTTGSFDLCAPGPCPPEPLQ